MITKEHFSQGSLVLLALLAGLSSQVHADGAFFSDRQQHLVEPEQKAVVVWDGQTETLLVSSRVRTDEKTDISRLAWVIPLTSTVKPEVSAGDMQVFKGLVAFFAPQREFGTVGAAAEAVTVLERKQVDLYDIAVLKAADAHDLISWLNGNGFAFPASALPVVQEYVHGEDTYFVANRIDLGNRPDLTSEDLATLLQSGLAMPLQITFRPPAPVYPLRISSIHEGQSTVEVYVCAPFPAEDASGTMTADVVKALPMRVRKQLARFLDLHTVSHVTRLSYRGRLSEVATDAVFRPAAGVASTAGGAQEELAFIRLFQDAKVEDHGNMYGADYVYDEELVGHLLAYAAQHHTSRFADDVVFLLASHTLEISRVLPEALEALLARVAPQELHLEALTLAEMPPLEKSRSLYYARRGSLKAFVLLRLAVHYRFAVENREASGRIAMALLPALPRLPEHDAQLVQLLLPEHQHFEEQFDAALAAIEQEDWPTAERALEQAVTLKKAYTPCHLAPHCSKNLPAAWYLLGMARRSMQQWGAARVAFEEMLQIAPDYHEDSLFLDGSKTFLSVSADAARVNRVVSYLEEGAIERGLDEGLQLLRRLEEETHLRLRGSHAAVGLAHYNVACAYAKTNDTPRALAHLKEALIEEPRLATDAAQDKDFVALHDTAAFKDLPGQVTREKQEIETLSQSQAIAPLLGGLQAPAPRVRRATVEALARTADPRAVEALLQALGDENPLVRGAAVQALGVPKDPRIVPPLIAVLHDPSPSVRYNAAVGLRKMRDPRAVEPLLHALRDANRDVQAEALRALGESGDPRVREPITALLGDVDSHVRSQAACALSDYMDQSVAPLVTELQDKHARARLSPARRSAIWSLKLKRLDDTRTVPPLLVALRDGDRSVRFCAARALHAFLDDARVAETLEWSWNDSTEAERLLETLWDEEWLVRAAAVWALGVARTPRAVEPLLAMLGDSDRKVRSRAVWALGRSAAPRAVAPLWQSRQDAALPVQWSASTTFALFPDARIGEALQGMLQDEDAEVRQQAVEALKRMRGPTGGSRTGSEH